MTERNEHKVQSNIWKYSDTAAIVLIVAMMVMQLSLTKILAGIVPLFNTTYNTPAICIIYVLIMAAVYVLVFAPRISGEGMRETLKSIWEKYGFLIIELGLLLISIISTDVVTVAKNQLRVTNILTHNLDYLYSFLALPMIVLLAEKKWKKDNFFDLILVLSVASMLLRTFVSVYYSLTGIEITCIAKENATVDWFRDGRLRVTAPCFITLITPLAIYMLQVTKSVIKRILYAIVLGITAMFTYFIWQSRAGLMIMLGSAAVMLLFCIMSKKQFCIRWGIVVAALIGFVAMGGIQKIIRFFSTDDTINPYSGENKGHYFAYELFWGRFLKSPWGEGLSETLAQWYPNGRALWMCDAGIMYSLVPMGILILIFFVAVFGRGIYVYIKGMKKSKMAVLSLSLTLAMIVAETSYDCFFMPVAFMVPFYLAIVEFASLDQSVSN